MFEQQQQQRRKKLDCSHNDYSIVRFSLLPPSSHHAAFGNNEFDEGRKQNLTILFDMLHARQTHHRLYLNTFFSWTCKHTSLTSIISIGKKDRRANEKTRNEIGLFVVGNVHCVCVCVVNDQIEHFVFQKKTLVLSSSPSMAASPLQLGKCPH